MESQKIAKLVKRVKKKNSLAFKILEDYDKSKFSDIKWKTSEKSGKNA